MLRVVAIVIGGMVFIVLQLATAAVLEAWLGFGWSVLFLVVTTAGLVAFSATQRRRQAGS